MLVGCSNHTSPGLCGTLTPTAPHNHHKNPTPVSFPYSCKSSQTSLGSLPYSPQEVSLCALKFGGVVYSGIRGWPQKGDTQGFVVSASTACPAGRSHQLRTPVQLRQQRHTRIPPCSVLQFASVLSQCPPLQYCVPIWTPYLKGGRDQLKHPQKQASGP